MSLSAPLCPGRPTLSTHEAAASRSPHPGPCVPSALPSSQILGWDRLPSTCHLPAPLGPRPEGPSSQVRGGAAGRTLTGRGRGTHRQVQLDGVHGLVEGPGELVFPERLYHHVLHILQLVGLAAGLGGVGDLRRGRVHWARGRRDPRGGDRRRGGHPPAARSLAVTAAARGGPGFLCAPRRGATSHVWAQPGSTCRAGGAAVGMAGHLGLSQLHGRMSPRGHNEATLVRPPRSGPPSPVTGPLSRRCPRAGAGRETRDGRQNGSRCPAPGGWGRHEGRGAAGAAVKAEAKAAASVGSPPTSRRRAGDCLYTGLDSNNLPGSNSHVESCDTDPTSEPGRQKGTGSTHGTRVMGVPM